MWRQSADPTLIGSTVSSPTPHQDQPPCEDKRGGQSPDPQEPVQEIPSWHRQRSGAAPWALVCHGQKCEYPQPAPPPFRPLDLLHRAERTTAVWAWRDKKNGQRKGHINERSLDKLSRTFPAPQPALKQLVEFIFLPNTLASFHAKINPYS